MVRALMAAKYRRRIGRFQRWHFRDDCPDWPQDDYLEQSDDPPIEEYCNDCMNADDEDGDDDGGDGNGDD